MITTCDVGPSGSLFPQDGATISNARCRSCLRPLAYGRDGLWRHRPEPRRRERCESGWTGDRCSRPLGHDGRHSNETRSSR